MAAISSLVHETTTTAGAGNQTLVAANARRRFSTAFGTGGTNVFYYGMLHRTVNEWEYGTGHMSAASTFVRDTIIASSNSNLVVTFTAGTIDVVCDMPAEFQLGGVTPADLSTNNSSYSITLDADGTPFVALALGTSPAVVGALGAVFDFGTTAAPGLVIQTANTGADGPDFYFYHNPGASQAASDVIGAFRWIGRDSASNIQSYGRFRCLVVDPASGSEDSAFDFAPQVAGATTPILRIDGDGIKFNADTAAANGLDDYEEGTFSPTLLTDSTNFTSVTYHANRGGLYTKIGKRVFISGYMTTSAVTKGAATGNVGMGGLPFTAASTAAGNSALCLAGSVGWLVNHPLEAEIGSASTFAYLYDRPVITGAASTTLVTDVAIGGDANLFAFSGSYEIA